MTSRTRSSRRFATLACLLSCGLTAGLGGMPAAVAATGPVPGLDNAALAVMNQPAYENAMVHIRAGPGHR